jgi:hypothetical protein
LDLAKTCCELAIMEHKADIDPPAHEGLFLLAYCLRMIPDRSIDHFQRAIELIDQACESEKQANKWESCSDVRFIKEKATIIFLWNATDMADSQSLIEHGNPLTAADAVRLSEQALVLAEADPTMQVQLHNNLCFYFAGIEGGIERAKEHYEQLLHIQSLIEPDRDRWSLSIIDTIVWAQWKLRGVDFGRNEHADLIKTLRRLIKLGDVDEPAKGQISRHLAEISQVYDSLYSST